MSTKIFVILLMIALAILGTVATILGVSVLVNSAGTLGMIFALFFPILMAFLMYKTLFGIYKRFINPVQ